ncbi:cytochrome bd-I oxidase subunit CydH [Morganella psychrotolerans]
MDTDLKYSLAMTFAALAMIVAFAFMLF